MRGVASVPSETPRNGAAAARTRGLLRRLCLQAPAGAAPGTCEQKVGGTPSVPCIPVLALCPPRAGAP